MQLTTHTYATPQPSSLGSALKSYRVFLLGMEMTFQFFEVPMRSYEWVFELPFTPFLVQNQTEILQNVLNQLRV